MRPAGASVSNEDLQRLLAWLISADARRVAKANLSHFDRHDDTIDVVIDTVIDEVIRIHDRDPVSFNLVNPGGFGARIVGRRARDLMRARKGPPREVGLQMEGLPAEGTDVHGASSDEDVRIRQDNAALDAARVLVQSADAEPWVRSGALVVLAISDLDEMPAGFDIPVPAAGANRQQRVMWPALWCAGRRTCLAADNGSVAVRQQRKRSAAKVRQLVDEVVETLTPRLADAVEGQVDNA